MNEIKINLSRLLGIVVGKTLDFTDVSLTNEELRILTEEITHDESFLKALSEIVVQE